MTSEQRTEESKVEAAKRASRHLRGTIQETLASDATHFGSDDIQSLKFHGTYQQDDRDRRKGRGEGEEKAYSFMVRVGLPGGTLSAAQYLRFDELAETHANGTLRVTTRQGFQFHGVLKRDLKGTIAAINHNLATTLSACGDVLRNVMACAHPADDSIRQVVRRVARQIATTLRPGSRAYHEIWLDGEKVASTESEEPFYGDVYLPRKFKAAVVASTDNCIDIYAHDVGLIGVVENGNIRQFNLLVGGGLGMTHGKGDTVARLADTLGSISEEHAVEAVKVVASIFRDYGNRADRRHARLKYLIHEWGLERFREEFVSRAPFELAPPVELSTLPFHDHLGVEAQADDRWSYGIFVQSGRIADAGPVRLRTALRAIVEELEPGLILTAQQNVLLTGLSRSDVERVEELLSQHGVSLVRNLSPVRRYSIACPALPTCGLAVAESERFLPDVLAQLESELTALGVADVPLTVRMTGCPNGCARPYTADLAFVGRSLGLYQIYVGGGLEADRVVDLFAADVKAGALVARVKPLLARWAAERHPDEGLGDYYQRIRGGDPRRGLTGKESATGAALGFGDAA
jgi:sulfite reductase beta subunit-like hemoprotein